MKELDEDDFKDLDNMTKNEIDDVLLEDEKILWQDKPNKQSYIWSTFLKMMPIGLLWLLIDGGFISLIFIKSAPTEVLWFIIPFFAIHLFPVWLWIGNTLKAFAEHKNIEYVFTNKRIIIRSGLVGIDIRTVYYADITETNVNVGLIDKHFNVGDIFISTKKGNVVLFDIKNPYAIASKLQKVVLDIKTDMYYPNDLRPKDNHGYNTNYEGDPTLLMESNASNRRRKSKKYDDTYDTKK